MEVLKLILEKVQSSAITVEEALCLIKAIVYDNKDTKSAAKDGDKSSNQNRPDNNIEETLKEIYSTVMNDENKEKLHRLGSRLEKDFKRSLKDFLNN